MSFTPNHTQTVAGAVDISDLVRRMISGPQIKMARAAVHWTVADLSKATGLSPSAIQRAEDAPGVPKMKSTNLFRVQRTLEAKGLIFVDSDDTAGEGVRLRRPLPNPNPD